MPHNTAHTGSVPGSITDSWIFVFSKFTSEALLFEALVICILTAMYTVFWVGKKRKFGSIEDVVPAGVVKVYLNELLGEAEMLRSQLFGLLNGPGVVTAGIPTRSAQFQATPAAIAAPSGTDSELAGKLAALEAKMADQTKAADGILAEKTRLEKELLELRAAGKGVAAAAPGDTSALDKLQEKIRILETKLAEYNVIEDDLANLKRLQQENAQLRTQLSGGKPADVAAAAPAPAPVVETTPVAAAPVAELPPLEAAAPSPAPGADPSFEGLVDQVEQSIQNAEPVAAAAVPEVAAPVAEPVAVAAPAAVAAETPAAAASPSPTAPSPASIEKSDADLVAEFEKMLNS